MILLKDLKFCLPRYDGSTKLFSDLYMYPAKLRSFGKIHSFRLNINDSLTVRN